MPLPPPLEQRHSVLDVACARPDGPPVVVEVDHTDRALYGAEAARGGGRRPDPHLGAVGRRAFHRAATAGADGDSRGDPAGRSGGRGRLHSRGGDRPARVHSTGGGTVTPQALPIPLTDPAQGPVDDAGKST